jgi:hypothetical protein
VAHGQNAGNQAIEIPAFEFWLDFERMQELPVDLRHWLEYEANDTYQIGPILDAYWVQLMSYAAIERHLRNFSRSQYESDYEWTGEKPPMKGKTNEQLPELRSTTLAAGQSRKTAIQMQRRRRPRRRSFISTRPVYNDADYFEW